MPVQRKAFILLAVCLFMVVASQASALVIRQETTQFLAGTVRFPVGNTFMVTNAVSGNKLACSGGTNGGSPVPKDVSALPVDAPSCHMPVAHFSLGHSYLSPSEINLILTGMKQCQIALDTPLHIIGQVTRMKADRVNADGSTSVMTTGAGGTGMQHDITAADNKATYALDGKGGTTTTNASINGFDGVKLANTAMQMKIHGAAHSLASNTGLEKILNETSSVGQGNAANKGFTESLRTSFQSSFDRQLQDGSDFSKHARNDEMSKISAMARAGGSFMGFGFGASGEVSVQGADGHQVTEKFSESTVKALKTAQDRAWNESISNVASSTQGMNWLRGVAQRVGNTEAYSMLDEARNINRSQQSYGENLTTAMVRDYAINRYHEETPETIRKSMDNISHFLTHGGAAGVATVNDISQSFLNRMGHQGGNSAAVQNTIDNYSSHVAGGGGVKNEVHQATARAEFNTRGVTSENYTPNHKFPSPPDLPSSSADIEREANARKEANQKGVKNVGSIQHPVTNAAEKALDFIGGP